MQRQTSLLPKCPQWPGWGERNSPRASCVGGRNPATCVIPALPRICTGKKLELGLELDSDVDTPVWDVGLSTDVYQRSYDNLSGTSDRPGVAGLLVGEWYCPCFAPLLVCLINWNNVIAGFYLARHYTRCCDTVLLSGKETIIFKRERIKRTQGRLLFSSFWLLSFYQYSWSCIGANGLLHS